MVAEALTPFVTEGGRRKEAVIRAESFSVAGAYAIEARSGNSQRVPWFSLNSKTTCERDWDRSNEEGGCAGVVVAWGGDLIGGNWSGWGGYWLLWGSDEYGSEDDEEDEEGETVKNLVSRKE